MEQEKRKSERAAPSLRMKESTDPSINKMSAHVTKERMLVNGLEKRAAALLSCVGDIVSSNWSVFPRQTDGEADRRLIRRYRDLFRNVSDYLYHCE